MKIEKLLTDLKGAVDSVSGLTDKLIGNGVELFNYMSELAPCVGLITLGCLIGWLLVVIISIIISYKKCDDRGDVAITALLVGMSSGFVFGILECVLTKIYFPQYYIFMKLIG